MTDSPQTRVGPTFQPPEMPAWQLKSANMDSWLEKLGKVARCARRATLTFLEYFV